MLIPTPNIEGEGILCSIRDSSSDNYMGFVEELLIMVLVFIGACRALFFCVETVRYTNLIVEIVTKLSKYEGIFVWCLLSGGNG